MKDPRWVWWSIVGIVAFALSCKFPCPSFCWVAQVKFMYMGLHHRKWQWRYSMAMTGWKTMHPYPLPCPHSLSLSHVDCMYPPTHVAWLEFVLLMLVIIMVFLLSSFFPPLGYGQSLSLSLPPLFCSHSWSSLLVWDLLLACKEKSRWSLCFSGYHSHPLVILVLRD